MNSSGKLDVDALLRSWPAPARDDRAWEEQADSIMRAALAAPDETGSTSVSALFEAPPLAAEAGEPQDSLVSVGEKKMSQESDQSAGSQKAESSPHSAAAPSTVSPRSTERKRGSLKDIAARASQSGAASRPGLIAPPSAPSSRTAAPLPSAPVSAIASRPVEAGKEDSGIVNLNSVKANVTPAQVAAAEKATPASTGLFDDENRTAEAVPAKPVETKPVEITAAKKDVAKTAPAKTAPAKPAEEKKKGSGGVVPVAIIAALGLAAAFAITKANSKPPTPSQETVAESRPVQESPQVEQPSQAPVPQGAPTVEAVAAPEPAVAAEPDESAPSGGSRMAAATPGGGASTPAPGGASAQEKDTASKPAEQEKSAAGTASTSQPSSNSPGDLSSAMAQAVGGDQKKELPTAENAQPAAGQNQNIPEQPSQGSAAAAIGAVMGGAKACVAGADDVSRAQITFSSSGTVSNVSVTGWATSHGATGCIKAALQGAKVGPFSRPSFTLGVTIRP